VAVRRKRKHPLVHRGPAAVGVAAEAVRLQRAPSWQGQVDPAEKPRQRVREKCELNPKGKGNLTQRQDGNVSLGKSAKPVPVENVPMTWRERPPLRWRVSVLRLSVPSARSAPGLSVRNARNGR